MESVPEMITMMVEPVLVSPSAQITLSGFLPNTTYYKYEDNYHNLTEIVTDESGAFSYTQDLTSLHLIFIQPRKSTKFIADDATGGDCITIGTWNNTTKTCTLTQDVFETIQIDSNGVTLDGNGYVITGSNTGYGIYLFNKSGVTLKNLIVNNFFSGIQLYYSNNNILSNNTPSNNIFGISLDSSNNNTLNNNTSSNNTYGINISQSSNNTVLNNLTQENSYLDMYVIPAVDGNCDNTIQGNIGSER